MKIEVARIGLIQDNDLYLKFARRLFREAARLEIAPTLPEGLKLLDSLASGAILLDVLGLDENLVKNDHSGEHGRVLHTRFKDLGLEEKVQLVNISTTPSLPIPWVGGFTPKELEVYILSMQIR